jgi:DNA-nicking Smr family endonuclease
MSNSSDDKAHFRAAMAGVKPLVGGRLPPPRPKPRPIARNARRAGPEGLRESLRPPLDTHGLAARETLAFKRPGVRDEVLRRLQRGQCPVEADCDLHGLTRHAAFEALPRFLAAAVSEGMQCVRVIHGKGLRSGPGGPVLKEVVIHWLTRLEAVRAFTSARPADGGTGAVYVLLATRPDNVSPKFR